MAFFASKMGNLVGRAATCHPTVFQALRSMSSSKIFIGGIPYSTDEHGLREAFAGFGEVVEARIVTDRETGRSRGFGFVTFTSSEEASAAISGMDGKDFHGRMIRVNYATDRVGGFRGGFGGGGYGGGYGGVRADGEDVAGYGRGGGPFNQDR